MRAEEQLAKERTAREHQAAKEKAARDEQLARARAAKGRPSRDGKPHNVTIGTLAETVLEARGKAVSARQVGRDENGLLVEWQYPDVTYLMARRLQGGIEAYRVIKIIQR